MIYEYKNPKLGGGHSGSSWSAALAASRSLASTSTLLKLRSRTGLVNTLKKMINLFAQREQGIQ
jgi:hypothetical protein